MQGELKNTGLGDYRIRRPEAIVARHIQSTGHLSSTLITIVALETPGGFPDLSLTVLNYRQNCLRMSLCVYLLIITCCQTDGEWRNPTVPVAVKEGSCRVTARVSSLSGFCLCDIGLTDRPTRERLSESGYPCWMPCHGGTEYHSH